LAAFNKFQNFVEDLSKKIHDFQAAGDVLKVYLSNTTPNAATMVIKADLAEITAQNGYPAGGVDVQNTLSETGGTATIAGTDITITATSAGSFGPFRYVVLYNDTPTSPADPLIGWWDYGSSISITDPDSFIVDFGTSVFTIA
jgi:hypothetical protein